jgi:hypothetical protein
MRPLVVAAAAAALTATVAFAKLPAPSDEDKAKAAETANKNAWNDKVAAYHLCQVQDRVASAYRAHAIAAGKPASAGGQAPPCSDPGAYTPLTPPAAKPLETSGAHSPPGTATSPPSNKATSAEMTGTRK